MTLRRFTARRSSVHGTGLFALQPIAAGDRLIEYKGEVTSWRRAAARQQSDDGHTFVFGLSNGRVIDGSRGGNSARFLNHACTPNCEAIETGERVFIHAVTAIEPGEELFIDYGLVVDGDITDDIGRQYACRCGSPACRRSMLANTTTSA
ncbi:SET domain-containing protein [Paraburkholderia sp. ZP32-5]|uniref:SET domain-containing protein n=1 Tax=Paraburkholderia sp. ZP32-5 TaxID=2883245 RepID=UPI001F23A402|nr:SET domain-containing protein-lysine N-methyltransferase [Paraburkholderia sp. ZP32-5]